MKNILERTGRLSGFASLALTSLATLVLVSFLLTERNPSYAQLPANVPIGSVVAWSGPTSALPDNWRVCDGTEVGRGEFPQLFDAIGTNWGTGSAPNRFKLPDMRGYFLRGVDTTGSRDPDINTRTASGTGDRASVGSTQGDQFGSHDHGGGDHSHTTGLFRGAQTRWEGPVFRTEATDHPGATSTSGRIISPSGGNETRPKNAYVFWIIRVR